jgi:hypothetical protein
MDSSCGHLLVSVRWSISVHLEQVCRVSTKSKTGRLNFQELYIFIESFLLGAKPPARVETCEPTVEFHSTHQPRESFLATPQLPFFLEKSLFSFLLFIGPKD